MPAIIVFLLILRQKCIKYFGDSALFLSKVYTILIICVILYCLVLRIFKYIQQAWGVSIDNKVF